MVNFDTIIAAALKEGSTPQEIAQQVTEALNRETEKVKEQDSQNIFDAIQSILITRIKDPKINVNYSDAGALTWLAVMLDPKYKASFDSAEKMKKFLEFTIVDAASIMDRWNSEKILTQIFGEPKREPNKMYEYLKKLID